MNQNETLLQKRCEFRSRAEAYSNQLDALANVTEFMQHMAAARSVLSGDNNLPDVLKPLMESVFQGETMDAANARMLELVTQSIRQIDEGATENMYALYRLKVEAKHE